MMMALSMALVVLSLGKTFSTVDFAPSTLCLYTRFLSVGIAESVVTLEPAMDAVVAVNSTHNVSYTCRSIEENLIWVVNKFSVWPNLRERLADIGVWTEVVEPGYLSLVMNPEGGEARKISVSCMTYTDLFGSGESSQTFWIISFGGLHFFLNFCSFLSVFPGAPGPVEDLELVYYSQSQLRLQWSRPQDQHPQISMTYTVTMRNAISGNIEWVWLCCNENENFKLYK